MASPPAPATVPPPAPEKEEVVGWLDNEEEEEQEEEAAAAAWPRRQAQPRVMERPTAALRRTTRPMLDCGFGRPSDRRLSAAYICRLHRLNAHMRSLRALHATATPTAAVTAADTAQQLDAGAFGPAVHEDAPWLFSSGTLADAKQRVNTATSAGVFTVRPLEGHYTSGSMDIGAHVCGLDLRQPLASTTADALRAALLVHKVLVLRDQPISNAQQVALASAFGPPTIGHVFLRQPRHQVDGYPEVFRLNRDGVSEQEAADTLANVVTNASQVQTQSEGGRSWWHRRWHTDVTGAINPPWLSILRAGGTSSSWSSHPWVTEHVHPSGAYPGHTHWVNLAAAYRHLPQVRHRWHHLQCVFAVVHQSSNPVFRHSGAQRQGERFVWISRVSEQFWGQGQRAPASNSPSRNGRTSPEHFSADAAACHRPLG